MKSLLKPLIVMFVFVLSACGSSGDPIGTQRASAFIGGALSDITGFDSADPSARNTAREIAVSRLFDMTPVGFTLTSGSVTSAAGGFGDFGGGLGTVVINPPGVDSTIELRIDSIDPVITNVEMVGRFDSGDAQRAIDTTGASYTIVWDISWEDNATGYEVTADQVLSGTDWV